jgi:hypothetical protein
MMCIRIKKTTGLTVQTAILHITGMRQRGPAHARDAIMLKTLMRGCSSDLTPFMRCAGVVMKRAGRGLLKGARTVMPCREKVLEMLLYSCAGGIDD